MGASSRPLCHEISVMHTVLQQQPVGGTWLRGARLQGMPLLPAALRLQATLAWTFTSS
jgi:hypothetical protein